jgi:hypothetical protein
VVSATIIEAFFRSLEFFGDSQDYSPFLASTDKIINADYTDSLLQNKKDENLLLSFSEEQFCW